MIYNIEKRYPGDRRENILKDKLPRHVVEEVARKRGITLSADQQLAFDFLNEQKEPVMLIKALAGTGKSTIATIIAEVCYETDAARDKNEAVVILGPSRQLRGEHALDAHFTSQAGSSTGNLFTRVLWLGRESDQGLLPTWDQQVSAKVKALLADPIEKVKDRGRKAGWEGPVLRSRVANVERGRSTFGVAGCERRTGAFYVQGGGVRT